MNGGGHRMAAGFTVRQDLLDDLRVFLRDHVDGQPLGPLVPTLELAGALAVGAATPALAATLSRPGPLGAGNREPAFVLTPPRVVKGRKDGNGQGTGVLTGADGSRPRGPLLRK